MSLTVLKWTRSSISTPRGSPERGLDAAVSSWNPAAERILGYTSQEAIGQPVEDLIPEHRVAEAKAFLERARAGPPVLNFESERVRKDGTIFPVAVSVSPVRDLDGTVVGTSTIARDRSEQVRADRMLAETKKRYRLLAENATDIVAYSAPDGLIEWVSPAVTAVLGWTPRDLLGTRLAELVHPDDQHPVMGGRR